MSGRRGVVTGRGAGAATVSTAIARAFATALTMSAAIGVAMMAASPASGQSLDEFDYENLTFRGIGLSVGYIMPNRVDATPVFGGRVDLGYAGPGFRIVPHFSYWNSDLERSEVQEFELQLERLIARESGTSPDVDLGEISWSDLSFGVDGHFVWAVPAIRSLTFIGAGMTAHLLNGSGAAITDTFIEDLLDALSAGFNVHAGIEVPMSDRTRLFGQGKYEVLSDLRYFELRLGGQFMIGSPLPDERVGS